MTGSIINQECPNYKRLSKILLEFCHRYPFLHMEVLGRSWTGRGIFSASVGGGESPVLVAAGFHGSEWLTVAAILRFLEDLCESHRRGSTFLGMELDHAFAKRGVCFVPCVNPDGVEIALNGSQGAGVYRHYVENLCGGDTAHWNANAHGVDINHNFDAGWHILHAQERQMGIVGPGPRQYGGPYPESEPETVALTNLCRKLSPSRVLALHSQGEEIFWHYGADTPQESRGIAQRMAEKSGYRLAEQEGLASHGGFKDWFIESYRRPGFTLEMGRGENPLGMEELEAAYEKAKLAIAAGLKEW